MTESQKEIVRSVLKESGVGRYKPGIWDVDTYIENAGSITVQKTSRDTYVRIQKRLRGHGLQIKVDKGDNEGRINLIIR